MDFQVSVLRVFDVDVDVDVDVDAVDLIADPQVYTMLSACVVRVVYLCLILNIPNFMQLASVV